MSQPIRVLHIFGELDSGGVSNYVMNLYRRMDPEQIQFDFAMTFGRRGIYDDEVLRRGGRIFYLDTSRSLSNSLDEILKNKGPFQAVHSHLFFYSGAVLAAARRRRVPIRIAHAHNADTGAVRSAKRIAYEAGMRALIRLHATHLLGCSEKACRYVFGDHIMKDPRAEVMPDGIDYDRFSFNSEVRDAVRKEYGLDNKLVVGHVGHFNPAKNHEKVLSVFAEFSRCRDDAALLLVGDGELERDVRDRAAALGLSEKVVFAGAHRDVERFYQAMDVFLFPSRYEGFGMAMIEAQASGLPCVASDVVPKDTDISGFCEYLSLELPDEGWADTMEDLTAKSLSIHREKRAVSKSFDDFTTASLLVRIYRNS